MFVHKKYPPVNYTMFIELTEEQTDRLLDEYLRLQDIANVCEPVGVGLGHTFPTLAKLLDTIYQERDAPRC